MNSDHCVKRLRTPGAARVYRPEDRSTGLTQPDRFQVGGDPADRHFAALAHAAGGILITSDDHLV